MAAKQKSIVEEVTENADLEKETHVLKAEMSVPTLEMPAKKTLTGLKAKRSFHESVHNGATLNCHFEIDLGDDLSAIPDSYYEFLKEHGVI